MFFKDILNYVYPNVCGLCGKLVKSDSYTCTNCLSILKCYKERIQNECVLNFYDQMINLYEYTGIIKERIWYFKFRECKYISKTFAYLLSVKIKKMRLEFDIIVPVPISKKRYMERGYNQCDLIVNQMSKFLNKHVESSILQKKRNNKRQSELNVEERKANVIDVYEIKNSKKILGKIILLVDDVCTTGSTINECAKMLKMAGAKKVIAITIAYAKK